MMNGMGSFGLGGMGFGLIIWLILIGVLIWGIIAFINYTKNHNNSHFPGINEGSLDILKKRYVKGEITKEQFNSIKNEIS
ncbi:MAG: SHOCT domain-containing protein [Ignavibacteriaceae bacterium]